MNKNKFYILVITGLLLSNILLIVFSFPKPEHERGFDHNKPRNTVIEYLHFDKQQITEYDELIKDHRTKIKEKDTQIMQLKNDLYALLDSPENVEQKKDALLNELGKTQQEIEQIHFAHFMDIKKLCKPEQLPEFEKLAKEISGIFAPPHHQHK